jgi:hypothetical protein
VYRYLRNDFGLGFSDLIAEARAIWVPIIGEEIHADTVGDVTPLLAAR